MTEVTDQGAAYRFVLQFYEKEPIIACAIAVTITITPLVLGFWAYSNARLTRINKDKQNIRDHEFRMKNRGLK